MALDKKITELPALPDNPNITDIFLAVRGNVDYQLTGQKIIDFVNLLVDRGSTVTFSDDTPPNTQGRNGDVVIKPTSGQFLQRVSGFWVLQYTAPAQSNGNTIIYGSTAPNNATGLIGDTYIQTDGGIFYKKDSVAGWQVKFTMATGPAGAPGTPGANGTNGTNGKTILNGSGAPSNAVGTDGDFYIDSTGLYFYGPKAAGVWPAGKSIINNDVIAVSVPANTQLVDYGSGYVYRVANTIYAGSVIVSNSLGLVNAFVPYAIDMSYIDVFLETDETGKTRAINNLNISVAAPGGVDPTPAVFRVVPTYAAMIAFGPPLSFAKYLVLDDEKQNLQRTTYEWYKGDTLNPNGYRQWVASDADLDV